MATVNLCPECLNIGVQCSDHPKIRMISVGGFTARPPRQTANNRKWKDFLERFVFYPEEKKLFKILNPKITDTQREAYWRNREEERKEQERRSEMQARRQQERFEHERSKMEAQARIEKFEEELPFTERKIKALDSQLRSWIKGVKKLEPLRVVQHEIKIDSEKPSLAMIVLSICESPEFEFEMPDELMILVENSTKLYEYIHDNPNEAFFVSAKKIRESLDKIEEFRDGINKCFKGKIIFEYVLDPTYYEIRRVAEKSW